MSAGQKKGRGMVLSTNVKDVDNFVRKLVVK
jgi:hypothetical protein